MFSRTLLCFLSFLIASLATASEKEDKADFKIVRVVYLVSKDRSELPEYTEALKHAIQDLQKWYAKQLDGPTFRLHDPIVEVVKSGKPATWFYDNPNGADKDNWGFNNTLEEASRLVGAKHNDREYIWILYSDGPGDKGRGGSGVACLPEDDLLGLVGRHPTQPDKPRWIAGLGHELGHAFGLPHPADVTKDADAIMWTGIYGKYPDKTYLTNEDKQILLQSPFFYHANDRPVFELGRVVARYEYDGGSFRQHAGTSPHYWTETKSNDEESYRFVELSRDQNFVVIDDAPRNISIKIPVKGGQSFLSTDRQKTWNPFYQVRRGKP